MVQLIDKSAVIEEIDTLQDATMENGHFLSSYHEGIFDGLSKIENFLNTIETKNVDLEKEFYDFLDTLTGKDNGHLSEDELFRIAEYFYDLGLNTQKEE